MVQAVTNGTATQAEIYDAHFVPALFQQWGDIVADAASITRGQRVLDVACGTGVLAGAASARAGEDGAVIGLDANEEMLDVARRKNARVRWERGCAESLPFEDASFDAVVSQFGFMFFDDKPAALREAMRVLTPGGRLIFAVCDAVDHSAGYAVLAELLHRLFGHEVAEAFRAPFSLGSRATLLALAREAGLADPSVTRHDGVVRFDSVASLVSTERACAWTLGGLLGDRQFDALLEAAEESFAGFTDADGRVAFAMPALLLGASKR